ncbi:hypothetical protein BDM02DRAFT_3132324 [Thelephora ganbajun]|uniref:Uncharacterized protein n=1 Tax=Thelephora ganbajun TaxID=370292 RepID=A0ACB6Z201_THEGA|nr:hypothetical protein BDM02DRAFT_3132324 [Thelephora ganbajun]
MNPTPSSLRLWNAVPWPGGTPETQRTEWTARPYVRHGIRLNTPILFEPRNCRLGRLNHKDVHRRSYGSNDCVTTHSASVATHKTRSLYLDGAKLSGLTRFIRIRSFMLTYRFAHLPSDVPPLSGFPYIGSTGVIRPKKHSRKSRDLPWMNETYSTGNSTFGLPFLPPHPKPSMNGFDLKAEELVNLPMAVIHRSIQTTPRRSTEAKAHARPASEFHRIDGDFR